MHIWQTTKLFGKLFILRGKPSEIPDSKALLFSLSVVLLLTKSLVYMWFIQIVNRFDDDEVIKLAWSGAMWVSVIWILVLYATLRTTLLYYKFVDRFIPVANGFVAMDCLLTLLFLVWLYGLSLVELPLEHGSIGTIGIIIGFILVMYWQFMVYIHLLVHSLDVSILKAGIFALFYILLQQNLAELLLNVVIIVQEI